MQQVRESKQNPPIAFYGNFHSASLATGQPEREASCALAHWTLNVAANLICTRSAYLAS